MIRRFGHSLSPVLLALLAAEALTAVRIVLPRLSPLAGVGRAEGGLSLAVVLANALVFTVVMTAILIALGLYERQFWRGWADMLLRVGVSFLFGLFALALVGWQFPLLAFSRGELSLALGFAGAGVRCCGGGSCARLAGQSSNAGCWWWASVNRRLGWKTCRRPPPWAARFSATCRSRRAKRARVSRRAAAPGDPAAGRSRGGVARGRDRGGAGRPAARLSSGRTAGVQAGGYRNPADAGLRGAGDRPDRAGSPAAEQLSVRRRVSGAVRPARAEAGFDLAASLVLLALTWPILLLAALAIGLESGFREPILYRQIRVGQHDRPFSILKFRTMRVDAGNGFARPNDPRITRVGRLLRETRIDELPQLINVLRGEMSLVGPRPERPHYVAELRAAIPFYGLRHLGQPGLTGWAQICYPYADSEESSREKLRYDLYYLKNASFGFDLLILLQTVHTILWGSGAR